MEDLEIVNVVWLYKILTKKYHKKYFVNTNRKSVYSSMNGWLCDCGKWTSGDDNYHIPINKGERQVYEEMVV